MFGIRNGREKERTAGSGPLFPDPGNSLRKQSAHVQ